MKTYMMIPKTRILKVRPSSDLYYERGGRAFDEGDLTKAKEAFDRGASLSETEEDWAYGMCQYALLEQFAGNIEESISILEDVMKVQSSSYPEMLYFQANNYAYLERFNQALSLANYYLHRDPEGEYAKEANEFVHMIETECLRSPH